MTGVELAIKLTDHLGGEETVSQSTVSYWETGRSVPTPAKIRALETILPLRRGELVEILDPERIISTPRQEQAEEVSIAEALAEIRREMQRLADLVEGQGRAVDALLPEPPPRGDAEGGEPGSPATRRSRKPA